MTGAAVVIISGKKCCVGKVRHSGYDTQEFFGDRSNFNTPFDKLWPSYIEWRRTGMTPVSMSAEIDETDYDMGWFFDIEDEGTLTLLNAGVSEDTTKLQSLYNMLYVQFEAFVEKNSSYKDFDSYMCGYNDYTWIVFYNDSGTVDNVFSV